MVTTDFTLKDLISLGHQQNEKVFDSQIAEYLGAFSSDDVLEAAYKQLSEANITIVPDEDISAIESDITPAEDWDGGSLDSLSIYLHDIGQYDILSAEEELNLAYAVRDGNLAKEFLANHNNTLSDEKKTELSKLVKAGAHAKNRLVECNLRFVVSIARKHQNSGLPLLDLIQSGNLGLMHSIDKFEPDKGFRLTTYAGFWIEQTIDRSIAKSSRSISLPVHVSDQVKRLNATIGRLWQEHGVEPTNEMVAKEMGVTAERVQILKTAVSTVVPLDAPVGDDADSSFGDILEDQQAIDPAVVFENQALQSALLRTMNTILTPREEDVLKKRFGIGCHPMTLEEVGAYYNVTRERIRQIEGKALRKMRNSGKRKSYMDFLKK